MSDIVSHRVLMTSAMTDSKYTPPPWPAVAVLFRKSLLEMLPDCNQGDTGFRAVQGIE